VRCGTSRGGRAATTQPAAGPPATASHPRESCALRRAASLSGRVSEGLQGARTAGSEAVRFAASEPSGRDFKSKLGRPPPSLKIYRSTTYNAPPRMYHRAFVDNGRCIYHRCGGASIWAHSVPLLYDPPGGMYSMYRFGSPMISRRSIIGDPKRHVLYIPPAYIVARAAVARARCVAAFGWNERGRSLNL
jgi:hypothetical protein